MRGLAPFRAHDGARYVATHTLARAERQPPQGSGSLTREVVNLGGVGLDLGGWGLAPGYADADAVDCLAGPSKLQRSGWKDCRAEGTPNAGPCF